MKYYHILCMVIDRLVQSGRIFGSYIRYEDFGAVRATPDDASGIVEELASLSGAEMVVFKRAESGYRPRINQEQSADSALKTARAFGGRAWHGGWIHPERPRRRADRAGDRGRTEVGKQGIVLIDKPKDITSRKAVDHVMKTLKVKRAGHFGSLDPFATGLLCIGVGQGTKLLPFMHAHQKEYIATIGFDMTTDTDDITGNPIERFSDVKIDMGAAKNGLRKIPAGSISSLHGTVPRNIRGGLCTSSPALISMCSRGKTGVHRGRGDS